MIHPAQGVQKVLNNFNGLQYVCFPEDGIKLAKGRGYKP